MSEQRTARETLILAVEGWRQLTHELGSFAAMHGITQPVMDVDNVAREVTASLRAAPVPTDGPVTPEEIEAATVARPFPYNAVHAPSPFRVSDGRFSAEQRMGWHLVNDAGFTVGVLCDRSFFDSMAICWTAAEVMARRADRLVEKLEQRAAPAPESDDTRVLTCGCRARMALVTMSHCPTHAAPAPTWGPTWERNQHLAKCPAWLAGAHGPCGLCEVCQAWAAPAPPCEWRMGQCSCGQDHTPIAAPEPEGETPFMCGHGRCRLTCEECAPASPAPTPEQQSLVLAAKAYAQRCVDATGQPFDISELVRLESWFYAGAKWAAATPGADVNGPQSTTMQTKKHPRDWCGGKGYCDGCPECSEPAPTPEGRKPTGPDLALAQTVLLNHALREAKAETLREVIAFIDQQNADGPERSLHEDEIKLENWLHRQLSALTGGTEGEQP